MQNVSDSALRDAVASGKGRDAGRGIATAVVPSERHHIGIRQDRSEMRFAACPALAAPPGPARRGHHRLIGLRRPGHQMAGIAAAAAAEVTGRVAILAGMADVEPFRDRAMRQLVSEAVSLNDPALCEVELAVASMIDARQPGPTFIRAASSYLAPEPITWAAVAGIEARTRAAPGGAPGPGEEGAAALLAQSESLRVLSLVGLGAHPPMVTHAC